MGVNNTLTEAEGDEVCWMVLRLCRAVRDEVKRDDLAPVDYRNPNGSSCYDAAVPEVAQTTPRDLTTTDLLRGRHGS